MSAGDAIQFGRVPTSVVLDGHLADLTPAAQATYLAVCALAQPDWSSRIGMRKIAKGLGLHISTVHDGIRQLREAGLLTADVPGNGAAATYRIIPDRSGGRERSTDKKRSGGRERSSADRSDLPGATVRIQDPDRSGGREQFRGSESDQSGADLFGTGARANGQAKADPIAFTFTTRDGKAWRLRRSKLHDLREAHPFVHVDSELDGIADWLNRNPGKRRAPGAMFSWLRRLLAKKQAERPLSAPAHYADGFAFTELPTDPTGPEVDALLRGED